MKLTKFFVAIAFATTLFGCHNPNNVTIQTADTQTSGVQNAPGFDVQGFANLVKTTKDPQALEQSINAPGNSINNMDLNKDGSVDYLTVSETNPGTIQVVDNTSNTSSVVVATLTINSQPNNSASVQVVGNQSYCGSNYNYNTTFTDLLILHYLLAPHHSYYHSSYHYGYYPSTYTSHRTVVRSVVRPVTINKTNPYVNKTYNRQSISSPSKSQRSFQVNSRPNNTPVNTKFGSGSSSSRSSFGSSSSRSSFGSSSSRSSFGSSRSSGFGKRH